MKFLLDESVEFRLTNYFTRRGHDVTSVAHDHRRALADTEVLAIANREGRILVTNDTDFGELIVQKRLPHSGVILFRLRREGVTPKAEWLDRLLDEYREQLQHLVVVTDGGVRVRHVFQK